MNAAHKGQILLNIVRNDQDVKGQTVLMPVKPSLTRWLSHKNFCIRMFDRYESIIDALDQIYSKTTDPQVFGVRAVLLKPTVITMIVILCDILTETNKLSLLLQSDDVNFTKLPGYVQSLISSLSGIDEALNTNKGQQLEYLSKIDSFLDI